MQYQPTKKGKMMNHFNSSAQSKWGLAWSVLALIAMGYTGQAQAQNASTVTLTGNVTLTTCFVKIATGSGAAGGGTGNTAHTFTIPTIQNNVTTTNANRGGSLGAVTKFTVGQASLSGGSAPAPSQVLGTPLFQRLALWTAPLTTVRSSRLPGARQGLAWS